MTKRIIDIREFAKELGLSPTTVSRVLNGKGKQYRIKEETQQRVIKASQELNYVPSRVARGLKMSKTDTIGLIIPDISNPFFADIAQSVEKEARSKRYSLILCDSDGKQEIEKELIGMLLSHKVDGIIIAPTGKDFTHISQAYNKGTPIVIVDRRIPGTTIPTITSDNYQGGLDAVNYLISMGHTKIACLQGIPESQPSIDRVLGYTRALTDHSIAIDNRLVLGNDYSIENGYMQTRLLFSSEDRPTAIFALSNLIALGVIKAIAEMGLRIPDDISLISFDEQPYSAFLGTPMTTINQQKSVIGQLAVDVIINHITGHDSNGSPVVITLKTNLIIRNSVKKLDS
jgi:LacI family transcriptional regulator